jgi:crossover junction endodeoxyribonuclease RuvC
MIILGIDPGIATTGFGVINKIKEETKFITCGCITTSAGSLTGKRLEIIEKEINKLINKYRPEILAIENLFFFKNLKTVMPVSQAKGVILLAASKKGIPVREFTPLQMKMAVTGYGKADKKQIQKMIKIIFKLKELPKADDAADALGIALCGALSVKKIKF